MGTIAKASEQLLLDAINRDNGLTSNPLTLNEIGMGLPVASAVNDASFNTYCTVYGLYGHGYHGNVTVKYRRYELEKMFLGLTPILIDPNLTPTKISDLLPLFNAQYGVALTVNDIVDAAFPANTKDILTTITAKDSNWAWLGSLQVRFAQQLPWIDVEVPPETEINAINPTITYADKPRAEYVTYGYDWSDASATLKAAAAANGQTITQSQLDALAALTTLKFTLATGADIGDGEISLANAVWGGPVLTTSSTDYNSRDFMYVNVLTLDATSNYAGKLYFHYNLPAS